MCVTGRRYETKVYNTFVFKYEHGSLDTLQPSVTEADMILLLE